MTTPVIKACPSCGQEFQPVPDWRKTLVAECDSCGFYATISDVTHADYLANLPPLPDISSAAQRIAARAPLLYRLAN